ncbi:MAG: calcium-binding EGF-like domain-containing protein, partial [Phycisphaerales bacterium]|nr:calcium-binding EGF-like domain-containing protein [Phycisphaerales bacterium]
MALRFNTLSIVVLAGAMGLHSRAADFDLDGIEDPYDACPRTPANIPVDSTGRPFGDFDLDCDVDLSDIAKILKSFTGPLQNEPVNECQLITPNCGPNATCVDTEFAYTCECNLDLGWFSDCDGVVGCEVDHQSQRNS